MKGSHANEIPFYRFLRSANSLNDMVFCPIAFLSEKVSGLRLVDVRSHGGFRVPKALASRRQLA